MQALPPALAGAACSGLLLAAAPAWAGEHAAVPPTTLLERHGLHQQQQQVQRLPVAPPLVQQAGAQQLLALVAAVGEPRRKLHWLAEVAGIGVINVAGLWGVLKLLQMSRDSSTPVSVLVVHMGLRVDSAELQERLRFLRGMIGVEHALFFTLEEAVQAVCYPPRGCQLAFADLSVQHLASKTAGYSLFKQVAALEQRTAEVEEGSKVVHGKKPEPPHHRNALQRLLGAAETQDAEESQACCVVSLVMLAAGHVQLPQQPCRDLATFRETMKHSVCGKLNAGQLLAVELLMTPDDPADFLSEAQLALDRPSLTDLACGLRLGDPLRASPAPSPVSSAEFEWGSAASASADEAAAAALAAMAVDVAGADGAASAAAAAAVQPSKPQP